MELRKYNSQMHPSLHTSTTSVEETILVLYEQHSSRGSGGPWVTMMTGKTTILYGPNGSQIRSWVVSKLTKRCRSKSRRTKTKREALNPLEVVTLTANFQPRLQTRRALHRRKISLPLQKRTSWHQLHSVTPAQSFNSESSTQLLQITVQPKTVRLSAEERKVRRRKKRKKKT